MWNPLSRTTTLRLSAHTMGMQEAQMRVKSLATLVPETHQSPQHNTPLLSVMSAFCPCLHTGHVDLSSSNTGGSFFSGPLSLPQCLANLCFDNHTQRQFLEASLDRASLHDPSVLLLLVIELITMELNTSSGM